MQFIHKIFERLHPHFQKEDGGRLWRLRPLYEAVETFVFVERITTKGAVQLRDGADYKRIMMAVVYALIPCTLWGMYNTGLQANRAMSQTGLSEIAGLYGQVLAFLNGYYPHVFDKGDVLGCFLHGAVYFLPIYIATMVVGGLWEVFFALLRGHDVNEGFFVTGLLFPLTLPATIPLWQVAVGISFGVVIGKELFGGTGRNFLNPALTGRMFLFLAYSAGISGNSVWVPCDGFSGATPMALIKEGGVSALQNEGITLWDAFIGTIPGSIGETSVLACLVGVVMLIAFGVASKRIMVGMTLSAAAVSTIFMFSSSPNPAYHVGPAWHLMLGGFAFGAVFMATDPVSAAISGPAKWIYGVIIGAIVIVVRVLNPGYPEGVMLAILFGNAIAPLLDYCVMRMNIKRRRRRTAS
ncbi:MAG TPA: NADH:ubiquinone reductase (Na(+)-transporting) subunit B [Planctomycetaceae bacterium]|nr:NADH:ubiquinone reductase (Na(+)-transporting) subunit B [Planctomycetaceae bacterium]